MKLSEIQRKALRAIADAGGEIYSLGGGYWGTKDGIKLEIEPPLKSWRRENGIRDTIGTATIYALENKDMLHRMMTDHRSHKDSRDITPAGRAALEAEDD